VSRSTCINTTTPAPGSSPVVLRMLFMHSSTGLAIRGGIVVLCRFWAGAMAVAPFLFLSAVYRAVGSVEGGGEREWVRALDGDRFTSRNQDKRAWLRPTPVRRATRPGRTQPAGTARTATPATRPPLHPFPPSL
jgi:hypothetical protein